MAMLTDSIDGVIGVDTHRDTLTAAAVTAIGGLLGHATAATDAAGYRQLLGFAAGQVPGRRCWAIEGAGSFGAGLAVFLADHGEQVVEVPADGGRLGALPPRATPWTPSTSPATPWFRPTRCWSVGGATGRRCGCS